MADLNEKWAVTYSFQNKCFPFFLFLLWRLADGLRNPLCESLGDDSSAKFLSTKVGDDDGNIKSNLTLAFRWVETICIPSTLFVEAESWDLTYIWCKIWLQNPYLFN